MRNWNLSRAKHNQNSDILDLILSFVEKLSMSFIATDVFKATIGLLINKARDTVAEKLKEGDVTDEKFRSLIVREIDQINKKLDGLARKDLLSSISAFKEGIAILFDVFDKANKGVKEPEKNVTEQAAAAAATTVQSASLQSSASTEAKAVSLANKLANLPLIDLDESSKDLLSDAKERFKEARNQARNAFSNKALDTPDRILAMMIRVMATILEKVDDPANALTPCRVCLEELHALPAVKKSFKIALAKGWKSRFGTGEREKIIAAVCDINHAIFDVTLMVGSNSLIWPLIDVGAENVHPVRDPRVAVINQKNEQYIGFYPLQWSFGAGILKSTAGICTNTKNQFIVRDWLDENIKVFDCNGNFLYLLSDNLRDAFIHDVATDQADNIYVLCKNKDSLGYQVRVFDKDNNAHGCFGCSEFTPRGHLFIVQEKSKPESKKIFVFGPCRNDQLVVKVIEISDGFLQDEKIVRYSGRFDSRTTSTTVSYNGNVMAATILDNLLTEVNVLSAEGEFRHKFNVVCNMKRRQFPRVAIHTANEHIIIVISHDFVGTLAVWQDIEVLIYKEDGKLVHHFPIERMHQFCRIRVVTMNKQGRIALELMHLENPLGKGKILVI